MIDYVVGIDVGFRGAISVIRKDMTVKDIFDMPVVGDGKERMYHLGVLKKFFKACTLEKTFVMIEKTFPRPKVLAGSASSSWWLGGGFLLMVGMVEMAGLRYNTVTPITWQREFFKGKKGESKLQAFETAHSLFPQEVLSRVNRRGKVVLLDGRSDSLLIAEYGRRKILGK